jgi:uncharacterized membrane protein
MILQSLPIHPQLVHFPIALFLLGGIATLIFLWRGKASLRIGGFSSLVAGWLLMLPTVVAGLIEASRLEDGTAADRLADRHTLFAFSAWFIFSFVIFLLIKWRRRIDERNLRILLAGLILIGFIGLLITSNLGGRLVYEMGVGVLK